MWIVLAIVATIPLLLGWLVLGPVTVASVYAGYCDIFEPAPAARRTRRLILDGGSTAAEGLRRVQLSGDWPLTASRTRFAKAGGALRRKNQRSVLVSPTGSKSCASSRWATASR